MLNSDYIVDAEVPDFEMEAIQKLENDGVVVITNLLDKNIVEEIFLDAKEILNKPSNRGSYGYITKDAYKRMYDGFLFSKHTVNTVSHPKIISIIEGYLQEKIVMTECMLKHDLGSDSVYFPYHRHTGSDLVNVSGNKFGCGVIYYLHDTSEGAFCYLPGSHKLPIDNKINLVIQDSKKNQIIENLCRMDGPKGSLVIFNEAGWHGPEQPISKPRTVVLSGYQSKSFSENKTRTEIPILTSNIQSLSDIQKEALGFSSGSRARYMDYHMRNANTSTIDKLHQFMVEGLFRLIRWKQRLKK